MAKKYYRVVEKCDHDPRVFEMYRSDDRFMCEVYVDHHQYDRPHCYLEIEDVVEIDEFVPMSEYKESRGEF